MDRLPRSRRIYDQFNEHDEQYAANYPLSKQILDYYYNFGKERNLERYLKLNRSLHSKSSSEGSLDHHSSRRRPRCVHFEQRERAKSMEQLGGRRQQSEEKLVQTESTSYQSCVDDMDQEDLDVEASSSSELIVATGQGEEMKQLRKVSVKRDQVKKSYQINVESKVEIAFPTQFYQAMTAGMVIPPPAPPAPPVVVHQDEEEATSDSIIAEQQEKKKTSIEIGPDQSLVNETRLGSPASSIASNKQRLEWDSLGDVGYQRSKSEPRDAKPVSKSMSNKSSKSSTNPPTLTSSKSTGAIPKRKSIEEETIPKKSVVKSEKWRQLLQKVKDKSSIMETPSSSKILFNPNNSKFAQSTPVASPVELKSMGVEKSSQTSDIGTMSRSIQAIFEHIDKTTSMSSAEHESTAGSFEYIKGPTPNHQQQEDKGCSARSESTSSPSVSENSKRVNTIRVRKEISDYLGNVTGRVEYAEGEFAKAVNYIALLFESKSIDRKFKRKLVEKIISKLLRSKVSPPSRKSSSVAKVSDSSESSMKSSIKCDSSRNSTRLSDIKQSELLKDWLKPMTNSEIEYERRKEEEEEQRLNSLEEPGETDKQEPPPPESEIEVPTSRPSSSSTQNGKEKEKNLQLKCIEREIEYLERIKKLIENGRMNLMDDTTKNMKVMQRQNVRSESRTTAEESLSFTASSSTETRARSSISVASSKRTQLSDWDSHKNLQIVIKDRRKLNTPPSIGEERRTEDLKEFVDRRTKEFAERYEKEQRARAASVYTDPGKHYSEPNASTDRSNLGVDRRANGYGIKLVNASTSVNSCEFSCTGPEFNSKTISTIESSASKCAAKSNKNRSRSSANLLTAGTQTSGSISFSAPILGPRTSSRTSGGISRDCQTTGVTSMKQKKNKILQTCPDSIAYTIVLNPPCKETPLPTTRTEVTKSEVSIAASGADDYYEKLDEGTMAKMRICEKGRLRLEDYLKINRPDFIENASERKEEVETARRRRVQKNHEKENLLMSPNLPRSKISKLLEASLRDPHCNKVSKNSSFSYKQQARRKYKRLPEVVKKDEMEKQKAYKRNTKILAEVFNRNLQQIVLQGEMNIPHSRRVLKTL